MRYVRYGIYFTPNKGPLAAAGAAWLGWDLVAGQECTPVGGQLTERPRRYGFHATLKAPFHLADGASAEALAKATSALAEALSPVALHGVEINKLGSFLALTPSGDPTALRAFAKRVVIELDTFRAPLSEAERARKIRPNMHPDLRANLEQFGYPHVLDRFNFHMTLTGPLNEVQTTDAIAKAAAHFDDKIPNPLMLDSLTLVGENTDGHFKEIERFPVGQRAE